MRITVLITEGARPSTSHPESLFLTSRLTPAAGSQHGHWIAELSKVL